MNKFYDSERSFEEFEEKAICFLFGIESHEEVVEFHIYKKYFILKICTDLINYSYKIFSNEFERMLFIEEDTKFNINTCTRIIDEVTENEKI